MTITRTPSRSFHRIGRPRLAVLLAAALAAVTALPPQVLAASTTPAADTAKPATATQTAATDKAQKAPPFRNFDGQVFGYLKSSNGAWSTVCNQENKDNCLLLQRVASQERPEVELSVTVFRYLDTATKKKATVMRIFLPLDANVFLPAGLGLYVDGVDLGRAYFVRCSSVGCFAEAVIGDDVVKQLKAGKQAVFTVFLSREEDGMGVPVDLTGFSSAMDALQ